jgi:ABC-type molybdate transport system ATPase subunit
MFLKKISILLLAILFCFLGCVNKKKELVFRVGGAPSELDLWKKDCLTPRERNIAMVFQNYALYPHL